MTAVDYAPRPATQITPPLTYMNPSRVFLTKTERLNKNRKGEPTLGDVRPPYVSNSPRPSTPPTRGTARVWDSVQKKMVPIGERYWEQRMDAASTEPPQEYHLRYSDTAPGTRIFTPCHKRPCTEEDHTDVTGKVVRWKGCNHPTSEDLSQKPATAEDLSLPPFDGLVLGYPPKDAPPVELTPTDPSTLPGPRSSSPVSQEDGQGISTGTAPHLGSVTDIERRREAYPMLKLPAPKPTPDQSTLRGSRRWLGTLLPSFRAPMDEF